MEKFLYCAFLRVYMLFTCFMNLAFVSLAIFARNIHPVSLG